VPNHGSFSVRLPIAVVVGNTATPGFVVVTTAGDVKVPRWPVPWMSASRPKILREGGTPSGVPPRTATGDSKDLPADTVNSVIVPQHFGQKTGQPGGKQWRFWPACQQGIRGIAKGIATFTAGRAALAVRNRRSGVC
jgi:hypothetical protein